jgi:myo-inositol-1(or 4)-monophosphatase
MNNELLQCAVQAALKSGKILKEGFGTHFKISNKEGRNNLVTEYDHLSEKTIIEHINQNYPDHTFLAEESGETGLDKPGVVRWIVDPLDGTVNFAHSLPIFSISIAAELDGEILCGVVYHPMLDELFTAAKGKGAFLNGNPIQVSTTEYLYSSFLVTGFPYNVDKNPSNCVDTFVSIIKSGIPVRRLGSAALDLAYVAAGRFDGFWEINLNPWDVAAGILLVREAGGLVTQYNKAPYNLMDKSILATNGRVHDESSQTLLQCYIEINEDN